MTTNAAIRQQAFIEELPVVLRLALVAAVAGVANRWPGAVASTILVTVLALWPMSIVAPRRWRDEISVERYMALSRWHLGGIALIVVAAFGNSRGDDFPTAALVALGAVLITASVALATRLRVARPTLAVGVSASVWGIAAALSELPDTLGVTFLAFTLHGATAAVVGIGLLRSE